MYRRSTRRILRIRVSCSANDLSAFVIDKMNTLHSFFETTLWAQLGPLERQVLGAVWGRGSATVHEVREDVTIWQTYTTIMTTMDRLFKKGLLRPHSRREGVSLFGPV